MTGGTPTPAIPNEGLYGAESSSALEHPCLGPGHPDPREYLRVDQHHVNERWKQRELTGCREGREPDRRCVPLCRNHHQMVHMAIDALRAGRTPPSRSPYLLRLARETLRREAEHEAAHARGEAYPPPAGGSGQNAINAVRPVAADHTTGAHNQEAS